MALRLVGRAPEVAKQYLIIPCVRLLAPVHLRMHHIRSFLTLPQAPAMRQSSTMAQVRKPVIVRKFSRDWVAGYADAGFGPDAAQLELLDPNGKVVSLAWETVKWVCFVRDLAGIDPANPERLLQRRFTVRPRTAGLWLRLTLTDGDELEGLAANDRTLIAGAGLLLTPPDMRSNTQRIFVPRGAVQSLEVVSLIGHPGRRRGKAAPQPELFPEDSE